MLIEKNKQKEEHLLVKKYLEDHSLVESNIVSYNNFINHRMQEIIDELNETMPKEDIEIKLGKIKVGRPQIVEADGSSHMINPAEARIRGLTYAAPVNVEITVKQFEQMESHEVEIKTLGIGKLKIKNYKTILLDLSHVNNSYKQIKIKPIDGVLGSDILHKYKAVIDYGKKKMILKGK